MQDNYPFKTISRSFREMALPRERRIVAAPSIRRLGILRRRGESRKKIQVEKKMKFVILKSKTGA
jgi:hypothetical protein